MYYVDLLLNGLVFGSMYALMAVGLTLIYGLLRILHIAHAGVYACGAFVTVVVANATGSIALGVLVAMIVTALLGMAIYRLIYEPILSHPPYVAMIASMGLFVFIEDGLRLVFGEQGLTFRRNPYLVQVHEFFGITLNSVQIAMLLVSTICLTGLSLFTTRTRTGTAWRATVSNPVIATSFGIDAIRVRYLNFMIGSALAGLAGAPHRAPQQFRRTVDGLRRQLQGARNHRARRTGQSSRLARRKLCARPDRILRDGGAAIHPRPRRPRLPVPHRRAHDPPAGPARGADGMTLYTYSLLSIVGINLMLVVSLNIITGLCGQVSLGHGAFYGAGAYGTALAATAGWPLPLALAFGALCGGVFGGIVGLASIRLRADFLAVTTIGVTFLLVGFVRKQAWLGAEMGLSRIPPAASAPPVMPG